MKMWDGRFSKSSNSLMEQFHNSLPFDQILIHEDIAGSIAWAGALVKIGVFTDKEYKKVADALRSIENDYYNDTIEFTSSDEDIHMAVERILVERIGEIGSRLHTGRSRNDQVTTDLRLYVKKQLKTIRQKIETLQNTLVTRAQNDSAIIMPGFTHLQQAQPILLSHYWLSYFFLLQREKIRMKHAEETVDSMPLGSGALAGSGFDIDRTYLAETLGFSKISENSIDGVASRDFVLEVLSSCVSLGISISRYAEDMILFSSHEFGFIELDDEYSTGSSMMPQKKNPDSMELIRGKCGRLVGNYMSMATTLKGVGLTYYKDLQEDKEPLFDSLSQISMILDVVSCVMETLSIKKENIANDLHPFLLATDFADFLVRKGVPFRQAHQVIGKIVGYCIKKNIPFSSLKIADLQQFSPLFDESALDLFSWEGAVNGRTVRGGTSRKSVDEQIQNAKKILESKSDD